MGKVIELHSRFIVRMERWRLFCLEAGALEISSKDAELVKTETRVIASILDEFADHVSTEATIAVQQASELIVVEQASREMPVLYALRTIENLVIVLLRNIRLRDEVGAEIKKGLVCPLDRSSNSQDDAQRIGLVLLADRFQAVVGWIPKVLDKYLP